jgi:hypothetical protein
VRTFCSTISTGDAPSASWRSRLITSWTSFGDKPMEGSSISSTRGRKRRARPTSSCFCSPPDIVEAWLSMRSRMRGKRASTSSMRPGSSPARQRDAAELEVVTNGKRAEQIAALRHEGEPAREKCALAHAVHDLALEANFAGTRRQQAEQRFKHGRLARAIGADQERDLALACVERRLVEDREARRVAGDDLVELDGLFGRRP